MFPSYDMNPIAIRQMRQERLSVDLDHVDSANGRMFPTGGLTLRLRAGAVVLALLILATALV